MIFNKLPPDQPLPPELLLETINAIAPDSRQRKRAVQMCRALAKFAGLQADFSTLVGSYLPKRVNPRFLPSDEAIGIRSSIENEGWRWALGMSACYRLHPHEVLNLDLTDFPVLQVEAEVRHRRLWVELRSSCS